MKLNIKQLKQLWNDKDERNLLINIALAFGVKGLAMIISLFSLPLYMQYFGNDKEVYGLWATLLSVLHWIVICDLGLGNGLRNRLTETLAVNDTKRSKSYVSSTYAALTVILLPITVVGVVLFQFADLNAFFNIPTDMVSPETLCLSITILWISVCFHMVVKTINVVIYAIQKSSLNNILSLITSVIPLVYIFFFKGSDNMETNLITLTVVHAIASNLPLIVASLVLFRTKALRQCTPSLRASDVKTASSMLNFGLQFFGAQIFFMFITGTNEIIITKMFSASDTTDYSIYYRLFTVVGSLFMLALTPLWSKVTKDLAQKKYQKIRKTNHFLYLISALAVVGEFVMVLCCQFVMDIWLGENVVEVSYSTALIFAFYGSMYIFNVVLTTVANGIGALKTQILFYGVGAVLKIPAIYALSTQSASWNVVILYNGIVLLAFCIFQLVWVEKRINRLIATQAEETTVPTEQSSL